MSARTKVPTSAPDAAIAITREALNLASVAADWGNSRLDPMLEALIQLCDFSSTDHKATARLKLVRNIAKETQILVSDMAGIFEYDERDLLERLSHLEGGAK